MSIKKKLILIGICFVIILAVFVVNVARRVRSGKDGDNDGNTVKENVISGAEAYRLLSFLEYDREDREALPYGITYADENMSGWYDSYVNAVWKMGLIEGSITVTPEKALTYGECKGLIDKLVIKNPEYQELYSGLSFDFVRSEEDMSVIEFLELYEAILQTIPVEESAMKEELLFVLGREISEDGKDRLVADLGRYYYQNARDYGIFIEKLSKQKASAVPDRTEGEIPEQVSDEKKDEEAENEDTTSLLTSSELSGEAIETVYINTGIRALVRGQEIIYITGQTNEKIVLHNVWIKQGKDLLVDTFINGLDKAFNAQYRLSAEVEKVVGDIAIENQRVVSISVKPDMIHGKVLMSGEDFIEVEGYGRLVLEEDYKIYKVYGDLSMEQTNSILVGYETTDFVVSGGKISAALIRESIKAENIRVLLHTTGFDDIYHGSVKFTADSDFTLKAGEEEIQYTEGETVTIEPGDDILKEGRIKIEAASENGKIELLSIERSTGNPKYRGSIEISEEEEGLLIVNELPLEEYLYAVIPSEMPTYYGLEPLKVQAICARSYAYRHLLANSMSSFGAHVDDSISYQVYNNIEENEESILAVKDTYGKVVEYEGEVITAYYFSTSCGHTTGVEDVWVNGVETPYLAGRLMTVEEGSENVVSQPEEDRIYDDLSNEENFRSFIEDNDYTTYDSGYNWYRWKVTINTEDIKNTVNDKLAGRYDANPDLIQTLASGSIEDGDAVFESIPVDTVGDIVNIVAKTRETGGIIYELFIEGTEKSILVRTEYNIRVLLSPVNSTVYRLDGEGVDGLSLLPSAFFVIDGNKENERLTSVTLTGGGYGHGVGMSQNGVKSQADAGKEYEEIIKYYYEGTQLGLIYE